MGKIFFYKDRNFQGLSYEYSSDCSDQSLQLYQGGEWQLDEQRSYRGHQFYLWKGEYPDFQRWMGFNGSIRSCRMSPYHQGQYKMRIYERGDFQRKMMEFFDDCPNTYDLFRFHDIHSCNSSDGHWMFYENPTTGGVSTTWRIQEIQ